MKKHLIPIILTAPAFLVGVNLISCKEQEKQEDPHVAVTSVSIDQGESGSITIGQTHDLNLTCKVLPENATNKTILWSSQHEDVATIDANGKITPLKVGNTIIIAQSADVPTIQCIYELEIKPYIPVQQIAIEDWNKDSGILGVNEGKRFKCKFSPDNASNQTVIWASYDESIATINNDGRITTYGKAGTTTIVAISLNDNKYDTFELTITDKEEDLYVCSFSSGAIISSYKGMATDLYMPDEIWHDDRYYTVWNIDHPFLENRDEIETVRLSTNISELRSRVFVNCQNLKSISIGKTGFINSGFFYDCPSLEHFEIDENNEKYRVDGNCIIDKTDNYLRFGCNGSIIPSDITTISNFAFYGLSGLTSFTIPNNVETIYSSAFEACTNLESIILPPAKTISLDVFNGCSKLKLIDLSNVPFDTIPSDWSTLRTFSNISSTGKILINNASQIQMWKDYFGNWLTFDDSHWQIEVKQ